MILARFCSSGSYAYRHDTRIYLSPPVSGTVDHCIAAVIGKNPGSATPATAPAPQHLHSLALSSVKSDVTLSIIRNRFVNAFRLAGKAIPPGAYVQVWNLFYLCNPSIAPAISAISGDASIPTCPTEGGASILCGKRGKFIIWYAWGGDDPALNHFKSRFVTARHAACRQIYFDNATKVVVIGVMPSLVAKSRHPQGMLTTDFDQALAKLV